MPTQSPEPRPHASVIVLTYNARPLIDDCLAALATQTYTDFEVIVVDNASPDATAEYVRDHHPEVRLVVSPTNGGYGAGNNLGAAHARGEILAFLNPDAIANPHWLSNLLSSMRQHRSRFATSKIVLQSNPNRLNSGGNEIHYLGLSFCRGLNAPTSAYDTPEFVSSASGAACAIAKNLFQHIGGFDPTFFLYHDDVDLSLRALLAGERCLYVPSAVVAHNYDLSVPPVKWGWVEAHRYAVLLKVLDARTLLLLLPALLAIDLVMLAYLARRGPRYVSAKLRAYAWVARNASTILRHRRRAQATRRLSDRAVVAELADRIPYNQLAPPTLSRIASLLIDPWFRLYRRGLLSAITW